MKNNSSAVLLAAILATLAGCTTSYRPVPQYAAPAGGPHAEVKSAIWGASMRRESIDVYVSEGGCGGSESKRLFQIVDSKSSPAGSLKVEANQTLRFDYFEAASGNRSCRISLEATLEPGKSYSLVGGFDYKSGLIPILSGTRMCRFAIQDDADKTLVSRQPTCAKR